MSPWSPELEALKSSPDEYGNCHRVCLDPLKSKRHKHVSTYEGKIFSFSKTYDPRDTSLVIAKFPARKDIDSDRWVQCMLQISTLVRKNAAKFNEYVRHAIQTLPETDSLEGTRVKFLHFQMATIDSTTILDRKRRTKGDCFVFEDVLGRFSHFMSASGEVETRSRPRRGSQRQQRSQRLRNPSRHVPIPTAVDHRRSSAESIESRRSESASSVENDTPPSYEESELERLFKVYSSATPIQRRAIEPEIISLINSMENLNGSSSRRPSSSNEVVDDDATDCEEREVLNPLLQAFVHFFFCHTNGQAVVCGLKGEKGDNSYTLVTPVMHSLGRHFGHRDGGEPAVRKVLKKHRCSSLCRHLPDVSLLLSEAKRRPTQDVDFL